MRYYACKGAVPIMSRESEILSIVEPHSERKALRVVGWFSAGMALAGLSFLVGYELRCRYKFNKRTPYDFFSHAEGEQQTANEFGVGI
jgi:hypothetical protein